MNLRRYICGQISAVNSATPDIYDKPTVVVSSTQKTLRVHAKIRNPCSFQLKAQSPNHVAAVFETRGLHGLIIWRVELRHRVVFVNLYSAMIV